MVRTFTKSKSLVVSFIISIGFLNPGCDVLQGSKDFSKLFDESLAPSGSYQFKLDGVTTMPQADCQPVALSVVDKTMLSVKYGSDVTAELDGKGVFSFHTNGNCSDEAITSVVIPKADNAVVFYIKGLQAANGIIQVKAVDNISSAFYPVKVTSIEVPASAMRFSFSGKPAVVVGACEPYIVNLLKADGLAAKAPSVITVNLSGWGSGSFYSSPSCTGTAITSLNIAKNSSYGVFYYKNTAIEKVILQADSTSDVDSSYQMVDVNSNISSVATQFLVNGSGSSLTVGQCSAPFYVKVVDASGNQTPVSSNTVVNLSISGGAGSFYTSPDCSGGSVATSVEITANQSSQAFYFKASSDSMGAIIIADDAGDLVAGSMNINVFGAGGSQPTKFAMTGPGNVIAGQCSSAYMIKTLDASNVQTPVTATTVANLTGKGAGEFYSDSSCTMIVSSVTFNATESAKNVYYKNDFAESLNFNVSEGGTLLAATLGLAVNPAPASQLRISGAASISVNECRGYILSVQDSLGNSTSITAPKTLSLTNSIGSFYSDSVCSNNISNLVMTSGSSTAVVYFKSAVPGSPTLSVVDGGGLTTGTLSLTVVDLPATQLSLNQPNVSAGQCVIFTASVLSAQNSAVNVSSPLTVNVAEVGSGNIYSATDCSGAPTGTLTLTSGSTLQFGFLNTKAENASVTVSAAGLSGATKNFTVTPAVGSKLAMSGPGSMSVGTCSAYTVQLLDANDNVSNAANSVAVTLSGAGSGKFFSDPACTAFVASATISSGSSQAIFYFKNTTAATVSLVSSATGLTSSPGLSVQTTDLGPQQLVLSTPTSILAGSCATLTVYVMDSLSNLVPVAAPTNISIVDSGVGSYYDSADCSGAPGTVVALASGNSQKTFSYRNNSSESVSIAVTASGLTQASGAFNVTPGPASHVRVVGLASAEVGSCLPLTIRITDNVGTGNNATRVFTTALSLTGNSAGKYYSDAGCSSQTSSMAIPAGQSTALVYFKNNTAETVNLSATASGLTSVPLNFQSTNLPASQLTLNVASSFQVNTCNAVTITSKDSLNNSVNVGSPLSIALGGSAIGSFHSNSGCSSAITSVNMSAGSSSVVVYYQSPTVENPTLTASASGFVDGSKLVSVLALAPSKIALAGLTSISAGSCAAFQVQVQDSGSNPSTLSADKTFNLSGATVGGFYSDSSCLSSISSFTMSSSQHTRNVYFKSIDGGNVTLAASDLGAPDLTNATLGVTIVASGGAVVPTKLAIEGSSSIFKNACAPYLVLAKNNLDQVTNVSVDSMVTLSGNGSGSFYSDASCSVAATEVTIPNGNNKAYFYFKNGSNENHIFTAEATGLSLDTHTVAVISEGPSGGESGPTFVPIKLLVSGPTEVLTGSCGGQYTVSAADSNNKVVPVQSTEVVTLTNGAGNGLFYSDSACASQITSLTFTSGQSIKTFYFKDTQAESVSLQAYSDNLIYGSLSVQVKSSGRLNLTMNSSAGAVWQNFIYRNRGTISDRTVVLQNVGLTQANSVSLATPSISGAFSFRGGSFPGLGGTCSDGSVLLPNQQCSIVVRFQPTSETSFSDNLKITYTVGSNSMESNLPLAGQANTGLNPLAVAAGSNHTCVTLTDMSTKCYGLNGKGQLGVGNTTNYGVANADIEKLSWTPYGHFATQIVGGAEHSCALLADGKVICWGDNTYGQLGRGNNPATVGASNTDLAQVSYTFVNLGTGKTATKIAAGASHTCALLQDGNVKCWGRNNYGQLGYEDSTSRGLAGSDMGDNLGNVSFGIGQTVVDLASGANHNCVVLKGGQLKCWGRNIFGQLGIGSTADMGDNTGEMGTGLPPVSAHSGATVLSVGAGVDHTCAIITIPTSADPVVKCWGRNDYGQLGIGDALQRGTSPSQMGDALPIVSLGLSGVPKKLALGRVHSCVLLATGSVKCWGSNQYGQLGLSAVISDHRGDGADEMGNNLPTLVLGNSVLATDITSGDDHSCVIIDTNKVRCWGRNDSGQLGHNHTAANVASWGHNTKTMASLPDSHVNNYSYFEGIALDNKYTCGISRSENEVMCWGHQAQSGVSHPTKYFDFSSKGGVKQLEGGNGFMCALTKSPSNVYCWGNDAWFTDRAGQTSFSYTAPNLATATLSGYKKIAAGENFLCGITSSDAIKCFGWNIAGILGAAGAGTYIAPASAVTMTIPAGVPTDLFAGAAHACAINSSGALSCWGANNFGQLGDSSTTNRTAPTAITIGGAAAKVSLGRHHSCVVLTDGAVQCWGDNQYGQLGNGSATTSFNSPQTITLGGTGTAKDISLGEDSSCAVMSDDKLRCWGLNSKGELAIGSTVNTNTPQTTALGEDFRIFMVKAPKRGQHRCVIGWENARQVPFQLKCWGDNAAGQLGYGDTSDRGHNSATLRRGLLAVAQNLGSSMSAVNSVTDNVGRAFTFSTPSSSAVNFTTASMSMPTGSNVRVKLWGGGGGGGTASSSASGQYGGGGGTGGYVAVDIPVSLITSNISIYVAGGGGASQTNSTYAGGAGGGASAILIGSTVYAVAAGGGGGGGSHSSYWGGNGGGSGRIGTSYYAACIAPGNPGTVSAAGAASYTCDSNYRGVAGSGGTGGTHSSATYSGGVGYASGGAGGNSTYLGGGGGGGYFGGGSGAAQWGNYNGYYTGAGGGGGSNYTHPSCQNITNTMGNDGNSYSVVNPPNSADPDFVSGVGSGGRGSYNTSVSTDGGAGRVVIRFY